MKWIKNWLLDYNIRTILCDVLDGQVLTTPEREQFWHMVEYKDFGRW